MFLSAALAAEAAREGQERIATNEGRDAGEMEEDSSQNVAVEEAARAIATGETDSQHRKRA